MSITAKELSITLEFEGEGLKEVGIIKNIESDVYKGLNVGEKIVKVDPEYFRPSEVETLLGDPSYAKEKLGWQPEISIEELCAEMVEEDIEQAKINANLKSQSFKINL